MVPYDAAEEENLKTGGAEEDGNAGEEQRRGETEEADAAQEGGNENGNGGGRVRQKCPPMRFQPYDEAAKKYCLHYTDYDLVGFICIFVCFYYSKTEFLYSEKLMQGQIWVLVLFTCSARTKRLSKRHRHKH